MCYDHSSASSQFMHSFELLFFVTDGEQKKSRHCRAEIKLHAPKRLHTVDNLTFCVDFILEKRSPISTGTLFSL